MILVTEENFKRVMVYLNDLEEVSVDTETTGLDCHSEDCLFSLIMGDTKNSFYFNYKNYPDQDALPAYTLDPLIELFAKDKLWILHNAKFDMGMLGKEGMAVGGRIWDTMVVERVINSLLEQKRRDFSLSSTAIRYKERKDEAVEEWIKSNQAFTLVAVPGRQKRRRDMHFDQVPFELMAKYGCNDQYITHRIKDKQAEVLAEMEKNRHRGQPSVYPVLEQELKLLRVVYDMEQRGVALDRKYCAKAIAKQGDIETEAREEFFREVGDGYRASSVQNKNIFHSEKHLWKYGKPTKVKKEVNPTFDADVLGSFKNPAAKIILKIKRAVSDAGFFHGFLNHTDREGFLHGSFHQNGARTGRFTSSNPNMQNMTKSAVTDAEFPVRRAVVPREGHFFGMIDYDQMEYYLLLDYCNAAGLIEKVKGGLDVHSATAETAGIDRVPAKKVNFACIFGSGDQALADGLGVSLDEGKRIKATVLDAAPEIRDFISQVKFTAKQRRMIWNWMGRVYRFPTTDLAYKSVNTLIQGSCADVVKKAMVECSEFLQDYMTDMVLTVHDELVFDGPMEELHLLPKLRDIMTSAYPHKHIKLKAGIEVSTRSLYDKQPYEDFIKEYGNGSLRTDAKFSEKHEGPERKKA